MAASFLEIETKFLVDDLEEIELRLKFLEAQLLRPRVFETNYRFDTKDHQLTSKSKVLRLRQDSAQWVTFKEPGPLINGVQIRNEIEFSISDILAARTFLEAIGFEVFQTYEKFRTVYSLKYSRIILDELPIGNFVEIEGTDIQSLERSAIDLNLKWELKIDSSYLTIYNNICQLKGIKQDFLSFNNNDVDNSFLKHLNIFPADQ